jgi:hypothetical protein
MDGHSFWQSMAPGLRNYTSSIVLAAGFLLLYHSVGSRAHEVVNKMLHLH